MAKQMPLSQQMRSAQQAQQSSGTATVSNSACRQIVTAEQIVASATDFTQDFNSILQYMCNKLYNSSESSDYEEQGEFNGQRARNQFKYI